MQVSKNIQRFILTLFLIASSISSYAQYVLNEADKHYELYNYAKAIDLYEQGYQKKQTLYAAERLGECYALVNNYIEAESWYGIAVKLSNNKPVHLLNYAKALQKNAKFNEAKTYYKAYADAQKDVPSKQLGLWLNSCDSAMVWMKSPKRVNIINEQRINTAASEWGAGLYKNELVFASDREPSKKEDINRPFLRFDGSVKPDANTSGWTGRSYLRLYIASSSVDQFPLRAGTSYHIGPASFSADGKEVFFAITRIPKKPVYNKGKLATINIEIYSSTLQDDGNWSDPVPFRYNSVNDYSVGDPFVSADGKTLYFVSDMPGGLGGTDIYKCERTANGWSDAVNVKELNSEGNERTPFVDEQGDFYFSTDGRVGIGGLDVFYAKNEGGRLATANNMGYPYNSPQDDFAFLKNSKTSGFLSSNRVDGKGEDDIYSFAEHKVQQLIFTLAGKVFNEKTKEPLADALVTIKKPDGQSLQVQTDENGEFNFNLEKDSDYDLKGLKTGFRSHLDSLSTKNLTVNTVIKKDLYLLPVELDVPIRIENIYYDFDKSNIRKDAAVELDKLVKIMKDNPNIWIELGSHTDSRGNDQYNQWLSQSRANSAVQYIIDRGISKNRITAKGYGESRLKNKCANGVKCTEAQHQLNRRTEFTIVKQ
ncbi:MAG: OmpA family protein [Pedobacter sp.]|uniref:OmpA family protein n=1 Tax=Pedobacter sp. TaxID=1411316 RepID=UPI00280A1412|nr:OmpA family protein [Pedobacter sp.]MDQ8006596.1 OmpA family protein [Pedobacter sp.]